MSPKPSMNPHSLWAERRRENALRNARACAQSVRDVLACMVINFPNVVLTVDGYTDHGELRLEFDRLVFAGNVLTRVVPFETIMLLGTREPAGAPVAAACSVNSSDYEATLLFWRETPLEYHIAAWYSRWLDQQAIATAAMVELPHPR